MSKRTRWTLGLILTIIGTALVLYGLINALLAFATLYQSNLSDPLGGGNDREANIAKDMQRPLIVAAIGIVPMLVGNFLLGASLLKALFGPKKGKPGQAR